MQVIIDAPARTGLIELYGKPAHVYGEDVVVGQPAPQFTGVVGEWERRYLRRAVFVVDRQGILRYVAYMPGLGVEPNYDEVIAAAQALL